MDNFKKLLELIDQYPWICFFMVVGLVAVIEAIRGKG